ncbi:MAG: hypothetical protein PHN72_04845 [Bacilli bacterium]|nr:hypothetical protein [Bacilli bacterium]
MDLPDFDGVLESSDEFANIKDPQIRKEVDSILKGQLTGSAIYIVVLILSIMILYNQMLAVEGKKRFLKVSTTENINLLNRIVVLLLVLYFLYASYQNIRLAKRQKKDTKYLNMQMFASILTVISALIVLYVAFEQSNKAFVPLAATENPFL